jgi:hypothetical protein
MSKTAACVLALDGVGFNWLGGKHVLRWTTDKLPDVRGIGHFYCVTDAAGLDRVRAVLPDDCDLEVRVIDAAAGRRDLDVVGVLCADDGFERIDNLVVIHPNAPFLEAARIEEAATLLRLNKAEAVITVAGGEAFGGRDDPCAHFQRTLAPVRGVLAVKRRVFGLPCRAWPRAFRTIEVGAVEGLAVDTRDGLAIAQAVLDASLV